MPHIPDLIVYFFSFIGLWLIPLSPGRISWVFPLWFLLMNGLVFSGFIELTFSGIPIFFLIFTQISWIFLFILLYVFHRKKDSIHFHPWVQWSVYRVMGGHLLLLLYSNKLPPVFTLNIGVMELIVGLGSIVLLMSNKRQLLSGSFGLLFWNTFGFLSALHFNYKFIWSLLHQGPGNDAADVFNHLSAFPNIWLVAFWIPAALATHLFIFWGIWHCSLKVAPHSQ